ncbi:three-helix bundle dimerization domain-containing protein [Saccharopolyspora spinosa]|uniref:Uncharacterized protein n=1 Tax=Saccharopolyspora spinosa TaxID=60894 RepID=A0A2N3XR06_SACSN|nr:hypothetical protein [Saccharopolyspora spinosa]PKW13126.1 hypothetical protein A8926_0633 [Saccharopolyspora spinosa]
MDNIDHEWLGRELGLVYEELSRMFPATPQAQVSAALDAAAAEFIPSARVANYLPIPIRRRAQHNLTRATPTSGTGHRTLA